MDNKNNNMNGSNNGKANSNPVIINHYHYNEKNNRNRNGSRRNRNNNRGRQNSNQNSNQNNSLKIDIPLDNTSNINIQDKKPIIQSPQRSPQPHIIVRSIDDPNNMRIIPFNQNISHFMLQSNILKSLFERDIKKENNDANNRGDDKDTKYDDNEEFIELNNILNLDDLINLGDNYDINDKRKYPFDIKRLKNIIEPLKELKNVIGMSSVKKNIFEQLIFILQELNDSNMMQTVIEGPPGVGKTLLGKILAKIYYKLNFLKKPEKNKEEEEINDIANHLLAVLNPNAIPKKEKKEDTDEFKFKVVRRSDLIGQYVGSTAIKTQKVIDEAIGGVLFIDEVYSLGSGNTNEKGDSFAKEAIDTLNQNLSEHGDKFICIIAGYPNEIEKCFFSQNEGLKRRFPFKYSIDKYDSKELSEIFAFKVKEIKWNLHSDLKLEDVEKFIEKNKKSFEHFGGDIETLLLNIKIKHSVRIFGKHSNLRKLITMEDIKLAFEEYLKIRKPKELPQFVKDMYV
jgi:SpoVK/Ycf46/Vps4 family AAA+-type ATPase